MSFVSSDWRNTLSVCIWLFLKNNKRYLRSCDHHPPTHIKYSFADGFLGLGGFGVLGGLGFFGISCVFGVSQGNGWAGPT